MRRDILEETFRLLVRHFDLFTMIALTVWLPGHLVINYLDFFATSKGAADAAARSFRVAILLEGVFGPLVVAATLAGLLTIKQGQPPRYLAAMRWAIILWPRLFLARLVVSVAVLAGLVASWYRARSCSCGLPSWMPSWPSTAFRSVKPCASATP